MTEIYKNTTNSIFLDIQGEVADAPPTATCATTTHEHDPVLQVNGPEIIGDVQRWTATLGLLHTQQSGEIKVVWDFSINGVDATKISWFDVVVPLVAINEIRSELDLDNADEDDLIRAERKARRIIENFTGQVFDETTETLRVAGSGDSSLWMPKRVIEITRVNNARTGFVVPAWETRLDGWAVRRTFGGYGDIIPVNAPIYNPYNFSSYRWDATTEWVIDGRWGWERVPSAITEAALMLIEQRLCPESIYRDNYILSMTAADWRIQYVQGAFAGTGNSVVDQLLRPFIVFRGRVI